LVCEEGVVGVSFSNIEGDFILYDNGVINKTEVNRINNVLKNNTCYVINVIGLCIGLTQLDKFVTFIGEPELYIKGNK
jgi:hypothetical protein